MTIEPLMTPQDLAAHLGVQVSWVHDAAADGRLRRVYVGRLLRFRPSEVEEDFQSVRKAG